MISWLMMMHCMEPDVSSQRVQSPSRKLISKARGLDSFYVDETSREKRFVMSFVINLVLMFSCDRMLELM